ncbi:MAG: cache domain-containing protein, partial [Deltaproteobacteria bacterium]|nr:cache domain-containing protein [Deltaproteobacteria bacterium]
MKPKRRLTQILLFLMSGVSLASIILGAFLWVNYQKNQSEKVSQRISVEYRRNWEEAISRETQIVAGHIESQTAEGQVEFYQGVKSAALEVYDAVFSQDDQKLLANRDAILSVLGEMRDEAGRPRYVALDRDGRVLSRPGQSEEFAANPEVKAIVESVLDLGEAFYRFDFNESWPGQAEKPVVYLKADEELGWIVGAVSLYSESQAAIKEENLAWAVSAPLPSGSNLMIMDYAGQVLTSPDEAQVGKNVFEGENALLIKAASRIIRGARLYKSGFLEFYFQDFETGEPKWAVGYFRAIEPWRWVTVVFVDSDELASALAEEQRNLGESVKRQIVHVVLVSIVMLALVAVLGQFISKKASLSFEEFYRFFDNAASASIEIDPEAQPFDEFALLAVSVNRMIAQRRQANESLTASETKFRTVFDFSPQLIAITDEAGRVVEANEEFANFVGCG